jgi:hypothetical protein
VYKLASLLDVEVHPMLFDFEAQWMTVLTVNFPLNRKEREGKKEKGKGLESKKR